MPESVLTACKPGDIFVHRNIAKYVSSLPTVLSPPTSILPNLISPSVSHLRSLPHPDHIISYSFLSPHPPSQPQYLISNASVYSVSSNQKTIPHRQSSHTLLISLVSSMVSPFTSPHIPFPSFLPNPFRFYPCR